MAFSYENNFEELGELGTGGFGQVFKVKDKIDDQFYAVKKIMDKDPNKIKEILKEAQTLAKLSGEKVVRYMNSWVELDTVFIKMELCSGNLDSLIKNKSCYFNREESQPMDVLEHSISCQIFRELLDCVQYLHESIPPIIHRDLKPQNILISRNHKNRNCLKIGDFGLATFHDKTSMYHSHDVGTFAYRAPEVAKPNCKYNIKVDIFSLGKIVEELFEVDINASSHKWNPHLSEKMNNLTELITSMTGNLVARRPSCAEIITNFGKYTLSIGGLKSHPGFEDMTRQLLADLPDNSIYLDLLDKVISMEEQIILAQNQIEQIVSVPDKNELEIPVLKQNDPVVEAPVPVVPEQQPRVNKLARELNRIGNQFKQVASVFK